MLIYRFLLALTATCFLVLGGCASLPDNSSKPKSSAYAQPDKTSLGQALIKRAADHPSGQSGFHMLPNGYDAFVARAVLAQLAERAIDSQYYMVHGDLVGTLYVDQLIKAADRGVRIRFLLDDIDEGERDFKLALFDYHPNVEVRIFNPFGRNVGKNVQFMTGFGKQTRRAHNKSFTVDNTATILGGRNIGDEYFYAGEDIEFADLEVIGIGPVAQEVSASFDEYWNSTLSYPISILNGEPPTEDEYLAARKRLDQYIAEQADSAYAQYLLNSNLANSIRAGNVEYDWADSNVYADPPEKLLVETGNKSYQMLPKLKPYIEAATKELVILSPYFVPGRQGTENLVKLAERGVRVRILTNSLSSTDVSIVHAGYARYRKALLRGGVELYELNKVTEQHERDAVKKAKIGSSKSSLHAKAFAVDRQTAFIGSLNLDPRSVVQNTEIGVVIQSSEIATMISDGFDRNIDRVAFRLGLETDSSGVEHLTWTGLINGEEKTLATEPYSSFWQRFVVGFLRLMPIESQI